MSTSASDSASGKRRFVVTVRLTPRGGNRTYVVAAADEDEAMTLAAAKLTQRLPYGIGWDVVSIEDVPLM